MADPLDRLKTSLADRYTIERELGAGGMATVYLAQDVKHDRKVAIKVLRPELAAVLGAERFVQEIKTTANLQHPHILPLFDSGEADGFLYYVMPFIDGETLRDKLNRDTQLGIEEAVKITTEVADALDYAHRNNVIHRDIKPENILLHDGRPMVADFGIALAVSAAAGGRITETGLSLGTPHYMSPEQATAEKDLTNRSDIYSLGAMLYEMLAGDPPHTGSTAQQIIAKIVTDEPRLLTELRNTVPPNVAAATTKALERLPADRFPTASAFAEALANPTFGVVGAGGAQSDDARMWRRRTVGAALAAMLFLIAALWGWLRPVPQAVTTVPSRLAINTSAIGGSGVTSQDRLLTFTPDGSALLYTLVDARGANRVMHHPLDAEGPTVLTLENYGTNWGNPLVSPDGQWFVMSTPRGALFRFLVDGGRGEQVDLGFAVSSFFAWGADQDLWITPRTDDTVVFRVGIDDTMALRVEGFATARMQQVLSDGRRALMVVGRDQSASNIAALVDLETGEATTLLSTGVAAIRYTAGFLVYALGNGTLMASPFNLGRGEVTGAAVTIATGVSLAGGGVVQLVVAPNGAVAYVPDESRSLVFVDRATGAIRSATPERHSYHAPQFSSDGRRVSVDFSSADGRDVWMLDLTNGTLSKATFDGNAYDASWMPDGRTLTYTILRDDVTGIYRSRPGSAEPAESLFADVRVVYTGVWLNDGSALIVEVGFTPGTPSDLVILRNGRGPIEPLVATRFLENYVAVSPDDRWLAYGSDLSGRPEVYVRTLDGSGDAVQVSQSGGTEPVWSPDGADLYYRGVTDGQPMLMRVEIRTSPAGITVGSRSALFPAGEFVGSLSHANYDISPDGQRFVMIRRSPSSRIMIIQNLPGLVERLGGR